MKNKLLRVPIISIVCGIILNIISQAIIFIMVKGTNAFTEHMSTTHTFITGTLAIIFIVFTGLFFLRDMNKKEVIHSAAIVSIYSIILLALEQIFQALGLFSLMMFVDTVLYIPLHMYSALFSLLFKLTHWNFYFGIFLSLLSPFLYVLFARKTERGKKEYTSY